MKLGQQVTGTGIFGGDLCRLDVSSASECKAAAAAAARVFLKRAFKRFQAATGVALFQVLTKKCRGPRPLVLHTILEFSSPIPAIVHQLSLWNEMSSF